MSGQQHVPAAFYPQEGPVTHFTGGWVGPRAGLDGRKISSLPGFHPEPSSPSQSLYQLSYPAHDAVQSYTQKLKNSDASNGHAARTQFPPLLRNHSGVMCWDRHCRSLIMAVFETGRGFRYKKGKFGELQSCSNVAICM